MSIIEFFAIVGLLFTLTIVARTTGQEVVKAWNRLK